METVHMCAQWEARVAFCWVWMCITDLFSIPPPFFFCPPPPHLPSLFNQEPQVKGSSSCLRAAQDPDGVISDLYVTASRSPFILNLPQWYERRQSRTGKINERACREFGSRASSFHREGGGRWMGASPAPKTVLVLGRAIDERWGNTANFNELRGVISKSTKSESIDALVLINEYLMDWK